MEQSSDSGRLPSVDTLTKITPDKEPAVAKDETAGGILSSKIVESIVNPSVAEESRYVFLSPLDGCGLFPPSLLSPVSANKAKCSPTPVRNSETTDELMHLGKLPSVDGFMHTQGSTISTLACEPTPPKETFKDILGVAHALPRLSDAVDGVTGSMEATTMRGASPIKELVTTQTIESAKEETSPPAKGLISARTSTMPERISPFYEESVSLGSSPKSTIDDAPEPLSPILATRLTMVSAGDSTYLCVSPFRSSDDWHDFLVDLRKLVSQRDIEVIEVLRLLEGEDVHSAWISMATEGGALCIRGYYMGITFCRSILDVHFVSEGAYSTAARAASGSWRYQEISTAPIPMSSKRGRSSKRDSSREGSPFCDSEGDFRKEGYQSSSSRSPQSKQPRLHYDQPSRRPRHHIHSQAFVDMEKHPTPPQHHWRPPSPGYSQKSRAYTHTSSQHGDRSLFSGVNSRNSSPPQHCRPPSPAHSQEFRSRDRRCVLSPRGYRRSRSPVYDREFRSSSRYGSPSRHSDHSPPPVRIQGRRSPTSRHYIHSPPHHSPGPSRIHHRSPSPRRYYDPSPPHRSYRHIPSSRRYFSPSPVKGQHPGLIDHPPSSYHGHYQELRSRDIRHDAYPNFSHYQHATYSAHHWMPQTMNGNPALYNGPPAAIYDPQTMFAFAPYTHLTPAPYQLVCSQQPPSLTSQQLSVLTFQPPPIVPPSPGPSQRQSMRRPPVAAKPSVFQRTDTPFHHRIQDPPRGSKPRRRGKRRGKRAGVGRDVDAQDGGLSNEDQPDYYDPPSYHG